MIAKSIYPLEIKGVKVVNSTEAQAVSNGWTLEDLYSGKIININKAKEQ